MSSGPTSPRNALTKKKSDLSQLITAVEAKILTLTLTLTLTHHGGRGGGRPPFSSLRASVHYETGQQRREGAAERRGRRLAPVEPETNPHPN